jgi:hypothetical protein
MDVPYPIISHFFLVCNKFIQRKRSTNKQTRRFPNVSVFGIGPNLDVNSTYTSTSGYVMATNVNATRFAGPQTNVSH